MKKKQNKYRFKTKKARILFSRTFGKNASLTSASHLNFHLMIQLSSTDLFRRDLCSCFYC